MFGLHELLESTIQQMLERVQLEQRSFDELESSFTEMIPGLTDEIASVILMRVKENADLRLREHQRDRKRFEKRLMKRWKCPLDRLDLLIAVTVESGTEFNQKFRDDSVASGDAVFESLTRLHARACQVSGEVLALLKAGFADGAHARWRSLHEMAVVASLIEENGQDLAERYLLHEKIQQYKLACEYQRFFPRLCFESLTEETFKSLKTHRDELIDEFGEAFESPYGWAASAIGKRRPKFTEIEQQVQLDHMRPYYKMASDNVHANSHGASYRLGLHSTEQGGLLLAGPSNVGLADPGQLTALSLFQITTTMLSTRSVFDCVVTMKILEKLTDEVGKAFPQCTPRIGNSGDEW